MFILCYIGIRGEMSKNRKTKCVFSAKTEYLIDRTLIEIDQTSTEIDQGPLDSKYGSISSIDRAIC